MRIETETIWPPVLSSINYNNHIERGKFVAAANDSLSLCKPNIPIGKWWDTNLCN